MSYKEIIDKNIIGIENFPFGVKYKQNGIEIIDFDYHEQEKRLLRTFYIQSLTSFLEEENKRLEGSKREATKHDLCTLDDNWCYDHLENMKEEELPNGAYYFNQALNDQIAHNKEIISYLKEM